MKKIILALIPISLASMDAAAAISKRDLERYFDLSYKARKTVKDDQVSPMYHYAYAQKMDFAELEHKKPLSKDFLRTLTPDDLVNMDQELADQLYARLAAGPIPDGIYDGKAKLLEGSSVRNIIKLFSITGSDRIGSAVIENMANTLWSGKHFYKDSKVLRNVIPENATAGRALNLMVKGFDYKSLKAQPVAIKGGTVQAWELFPAKLYCGQSLLDSRRESVIIDYAYSDKVDGYNEPIDFLASRHGLYVRDEIRMVRPGLYLGKAYLGRIFFLTFVLHNPQVDAANQGSSDWKGMQECWTGTQAQGYL